MLDLGRDHDAEEMTWTVTADDAAVVHGTEDLGQPSSRKQSFGLISLLVITLTVLSGIAGYYYYQHVSQTLRSNANRLASPVQDATTSRTANKARAPLASSDTMSQAVIPGPASVRPAVFSNGKSEIRKPGKPLLADGQAPSIRITRHEQQDHTGQLLSQAYRFYQSGDYHRAREGYLRVLKFLPDSPDAMSGIAAIAMQSSQFDQAEALYLAMLNKSPGSAGPLFALGNLYAAQQRWQQAMQYYLQAFNNRHANPDTACNLAVSLDRLGRYGDALPYYQLALDIADQQSTLCDIEQVRARMHALQVKAAG